jgi:hypothetical protein
MITQLLGDGFFKTPRTISAIVAHCSTSKGHHYKANECSPTRGSHRQFKHPMKSGRVTVAGKPNDDLAPGTLNSILKQAGLRK